MFRKIFTREGTQALATGLTLFASNLFIARSNYQSLKEDYEEFYRKYPGATPEARFHRIGTSGAGYYTLEPKRETQETSLRR